MKKISFLLLFLSSFSFADYLFQPLNICVKEFWFIQSSGNFAYIRSNDNVTVSGTTKNYGDDFFAGYDYNATSGRCQKVASNNSLGLSNESYTYLMGLSGLLIGFSFLFGLFTIFSRRS